MKVLVVTNMYPNDKSPYYGIFVKEQVCGLEEHFSVNHHLIFINGRKHVLNYLLSIFKINWHLFWNKYDVIHIHYGLSGLFVLCNPFIRTPIVLTLHSGDIDEKKGRYIQIAITKLLVKRISYAIILNDEMRRILQDINSNLATIPCGVNTDIFYPNRNLNKEPNNSSTLVFGGDPKRPEKNYSLFKQISKILHRKFQLIPKEVIVQNMTRTQVAELFNNSDCLLMTSYSEGSPQIVKEAMACNTPVISTDVGDVTILLDGVGNSKVVETADPEEMANEVSQILGKQSSGRNRIMELGLDQYATCKKVFDLYVLVSQTAR